MIFLYWSMRIWQIHYNIFFRFLCSQFFFFLIFSLSIFSLLFSFSFLSRFSPIPFPIIVPLLVVMDWQCSFGFIFVFAENWPSYCSAICLVRAPFCSSRFFIDASVFFWFMVDTWKNWASASSILVKFSVWGLACLWFDHAFVLQFWYGLELFFQPIFSL